MLFLNITLYPLVLPPHLVLGCDFLNSFNFPLQKKKKIEPVKFVVELGSTMLQCVYFSCYIVWWGLTVASCCATFFLPFFSMP